MKAESDCIGVAVAGELINDVIHLPLAYMVGFDEGGDDIRLHASVVDHTPVVGVHIQVAHVINLDARLLQQFEDFPTQIHHFINFHRC